MKISCYTCNIKGNRKSGSRNECWLRNNRYQVLSFGGYFLFTENLSAIYIISFTNAINNVTAPKTNINASYTDMAPPPFGSRPSALAFGLPRSTDSVYYIITSHLVIAMLLYYSKSRSPKEWSDLIILFIQYR